jgi:NADH:ubiquinone oxidoreductase subunit E
VRGADKITDALERKLEINKGQTTEDLLFTLEAVRCIGCCASGPVITVNQNTHGGLDRSSAVKVVEEYEQHVS